jgi:hypothetical protein
MANETRPLLVYTYTERSWELRQFGFPPLKDMAHSMRHKRTQLWCATSCLLAAGAAALIALPDARAQQPQFGPGFSHAGQAAPGNPAENAAYSAAISQSDPQAKVSAIQQFLIQYPNSALRQPAIAQMMLAKRRINTPGAMPPLPMNRPPMAPPAGPGSAAPAPATAPVFTPQPATTPRDSLLQHPAKPAQVIVNPGSLAIKADNSSLAQILQQISAATGMKVEGLGQDQRIFGNYGPGDPREVLLSLLEGFSYNVLMIGNDMGAPRELSLSQRSAASTVASAAPARNNRDPEDDELEQEPPQSPPEQAQPVSPPPPGNPDGTTPQPPRNPAELQQELLRLRQQQQGQQQQPQQQPPQ